MQESDLSANTGRLNRLMSLPALLSVIGLLAILSVTKGHEWGDDFALYLSQSDALIQGDLEKLGSENGLMMNSSDGQLGPNLYPHGYPAILTAIKHLPGNRIVLAKLLNVLLLVLAAWLFFQTFHAADRLLVWLATLFAFAHPKLLEGVNRVQADILFLALFMAFVFVLFRWEKGRTRMLLLALLAWFATEVRPNGIFLLPALVVFSWESGNDKGMKRILRAVSAVLMPGLVFISAFLLLRLLLPEGSGNLWAVLAGTTPEQLLDNAGYYASLMGMFPFWHASNLVRTISPLASWLLVLPVWCLAFRGFRIFKGRVLTVLFLFGTAMVMFIVWPSQQGFRYLYPLMPFFMLAFFRGVQMLSPKAILHHIALTAWILCLAGQSLATIYFIRFKLPDQAYNPEMKAVYRWVRSNSSPSDTIVFFKPRLMYLETGRISFRKDSMVQRHGPRKALVVVTDTSSRFLDRYFGADHPSRLFTSGSCAVFKWE